MKTYIIDPSVFGGQQPSAMPAALSIGKPDPAAASLGELEVSPTNPGTGLLPEAEEPLLPHVDVGRLAIPAPAPTSAPDPDRAPGGPSTTNSQYSTQGPIPKG